MSAHLNSGTLRVIREVTDERQRQLDKFGQQDWHPAEWMLILGEEVGEANREALEHTFSDRFPEHYPSDPDRLHRLRKELVQVAAVACAIVESLDRNELSGNARPNSHERKRKAPTPDLCAPEAYADEWNEWLSHRREIRKPMTIRAQRALMDSFTGWDAERIKAAIRHSIANGWQGIFEPKQHTHAPQRTTRATADEEYVRASAEGLARLIHNRQGHAG